MVLSVMAWPWRLRRFRRPLMLVTLQAAVDEGWMTVSLNSDYTDGLYLRATGETRDLLLDLEHLELPLLVGLHLLQGQLQRAGLQPGKSGQVVDHSRQAVHLGAHLGVVAIGIGRHRGAPSEQTDADVIKSLISDAGLTSGTVPATKPTHPEIVRYRSTAWDFLVLRADAQGLLVVADAGAEDRGTDGAVVARVTKNLYIRKKQA